MNIYLSLFLNFFKIGLFSFGGGYGMLPLMEEAVRDNNWLSQELFMNFVAISESTPGPIAVNMATFIGSSQAGVLGSLCATLGAIVPSIIVILLIVGIFKNFLKYRPVRCVLSGIKPIIVGLIFVTGLWLAISLFLPNITNRSFEGFSLKALLLIIGLFIIKFSYKKIIKKDISPIILIVLAGGIGMLLF